MTKQYNFDEVVNRLGTDCLKYDGCDLYFGKKVKYPLWVADTDFKAPDFVLNAMRKRLDHEILGYTYRPEGYYSSIINWMKERHNWDIHRQWITTSPGVVSALTMAILSFSEPGDGVIIQPPVYFPFFECVEGTKRRLIENYLVEKDGRYTFDFEDLKSKIDENTKILLLCNPHNPGGTAWCEEELRELCEICVENNILIVSDEIHSDLVFSEFKHVPVATLSEEIAKNSITCMAPSKTFNIAGMASAFLVIPDRAKRVRYEKELRTIHVHGGNILGNIGIEAAYSEGAGWVDQLVDYLEENRNYVVDYLKTNLPKVRIMIPEATYLLWMDLSEYGTEAEIKDKLLNEASVALNVGSTFGKGGEGFFRLNFASPRSVLTEALEELTKTFA